LTDALEDDRGISRRARDQVLDPAGLVFGGGFLRLDGLDEVLTQAVSVSSS
jgi:hypothetical protein